MPAEKARLGPGLCCPRCAGTLAEAQENGQDGGIRCERCRNAYPFVAGIPCLMDDPDLWRTLWLRRLDDYSSGVEMRVQALKSEGEGEGGAENSALLPRTRQRLLRVADGFADQLDAITALFEPMDTNSDALTSMAIPSRPDGGGQLAILECYEHVFRDWVWGQKECELSLGFIKPAIPAGLKRLALYGAGAGRLAVDLHQQCRPEATFALDINPLPFLVAQKLLAGEEVALPEFPVDPNSETDAVVAHAIKRPFEVHPGFHLVFADALRPPFGPGSLDCVVTNWFIDVARADIRQTAAAINRVLAPGGLWVNLGPLRFHSDLSRSYTIEEVLELVGLSGFQVSANERREIPYFDSPYSGSKRSDTVFRFVATKTGDAPALEIPESLPPWVSNPLLPIPVTQSMVSLGRTSMFTTGVLSMIDGTRSISDLAQALGAAWGVEPGRLHDELRAFLARLPASEAIS